MPEFLNQLLVLPEFASWLALAALAVSTLSYWWTRRATQTSQQALEHARTEAKKAELIEAERNRSELLCAISNEKALLKEAQLELGAMHTAHDADHPVVKTLLQNFSQVFDYLPKVEASIANLNELYEKVLNTSADAGPAHFIQLAAEQHRISKDTEYFKKCCDDCLATFREKRTLALDYQRNARR